MLYYGPAPTQGQCSQQQPFSILDSLFSSQIGRDVSGNFALSFQGLAVLTPAGRYVVKDPNADRLLDVTLLMIPGVDPWVFKIPVSIEELKPGDLIVASDSPRSILYVLSTPSNLQITALDTATGDRITYTPTANLFDLDFLIKVFSVFDLLGDGMTGVSY